MPHATEFMKLCDEYRAEINEIDKGTLQEWLSDGRPFHLIDVREDSEYADGAITGAVHISKGMIEARIDNEVTNKADPIVLYCRGGNRSVLAAYNLKKMGYTNVYSLAGGYRNWID